MPKQLEPFALRILIQHVEGATIAYLHSREGFELLGRPKNNDGYQFLEIGDEFTYDNNQYIVRNINFVMRPDYYKSDGELYGINMYSPDAQNQDYDLSCQMGVFVERV